MITLRHLSYFVAAAEHQGTAQAARALNVSQPSISVAIKQLEELVGQPLFVRRHAQGLTLTQAGLGKLAEARSIISQVGAWVASPVGSTGQEAWIEVGCLTTLGPVHLPPIIRQFHQLYPGVRVRLREGDLEELHRLIDNGLIEVALMYNLDLGRSGNFETLVEIKPHILVGAEHPFYRRQSVALSEVVEHPLILISLPHSRDYFLNIFRQARLMPKIAMEVQTIEMLRGLVANGQGIAMVTTRSKSDVSGDGLPLAIVEITEEIPRQQVVIVTPRQFPLTWMATAFIETVRRYFSELEARC